MSANAPWRLPLVEAALISALVLGLFFYWFALADRYAIFLYEHIAPGIPRAQPFDDITSSRYWMAGLVADGAVMVLYTAVTGMRGVTARRRHKRVVVAGWWQVWLLCALPIAVGIPAITMTFNAPTLPAGLAAACVVATLAGLALALLPGRWAAERPVDLAWLAADGIGLMPALLLLRAVELPSRGMSLSTTMAWSLAIAGILGGAFWLAGMTALRVWRRKEFPGAAALFLAGIGLSYVFMPLVHHLFATPRGYRYITAASNFFAFSLGLQALALILAAGMAWATTGVRRRLS